MPIIDGNPHPLPFVHDVLRHAKRYLALKQHNSLRILLTCYLEDGYADKHPLPSPVLVRIRMDAKEPDPKPMFYHGPVCEWRIATAGRAKADKTSPFWSVQEKIVAFLSEQFGEFNLPQTSRIHAAIVLREPLGVMGVIEGDSTRVDIMRPAGELDTRDLGYGQIFGINPAEFQSGELDTGALEHVEPNSKRWKRLIDEVCG